MTPALIDLRSDTVTKPTPAMRRAMAEAEVGDDVYAEDPTVKRLQSMLAERAGFEAGLFLPSGTQSNQVAIAAHTVRGQEVIIPAGAHIYEYEPGSLAVISGVLPRIVAAPLGVPNPEDIEDAIHTPGHQAPTGLISIENTHNRAGGTVVPLAVCHAVGNIAKAHGLPYHLDGARAFNAISALKISLDTLCAPFDSVSLCLSKGLAAPVGSVLVGSKDFIKEAHRYRKLLGGGMRQAGVLAAAGIVAVEQMSARLADDHATARTLAEGLVQLPGISIDLASVQTNMVFATLDKAVCSAADFAAAMAEEGVKLNAMSKVRVRMVTHYQVDETAIRRTLEAAAKVLQAYARHASAPPYIPAEV